MKAKVFLLALAVAIPSYVLPYPGLMPGHKLYPVKQVFDQFYQFLTFGSFSRHKYELSLADKKLVEARVLFEYQQYPLAIKSLEASNNHFRLAIDFLEKASQEGKDISQKQSNLKAAATKHKEVLQKLEAILPAEFVWQPEKSKSSKLPLAELIKQAVKLREFK